jgi:epoxyqueuosine reductase
MTPRERAEAVKAAARRLGFCEVGIAQALPLEEEFRRYLAWLERGYHATMAYLDRNLERRLDVRAILRRHARLSSSHTTTTPPFRHDAAERQPHRYGKISRYAWGRDYHDVLLGKLRQLAQEVSRICPGAQSRPYVDTGPVMEKAWAVRAGIGWQGKNTNIISRRWGSWLFLGVLITTAELEPDTPCRITADAAMPAYGHARRAHSLPRTCWTPPLHLSYWTIETKPEQPIPEHIAQRLEGWLFGCDICQEVCPWNRFQRPTEEPAFAPLNGETCLELDSLLAMTPEQFRERFRNSPLKRPKLAGLQRTARAWKHVAQLRTPHHEHSTPAP